MLNKIKFKTKKKWLIVNWLELIFVMNNMFLKIRGEDRCGESELKMFFNHIIVIIEKNHKYFEEMYEQIIGHLKKEKKLIIMFGTNDDISYSGLYYTWVITYGMLIFDNINIEDKERGMVSRRSIIKNTNRVNFILSYLNIEDNIEDNIVKILMYLTSIDEINIKKIVYKKDKRYKTDIHLKFKNLNIGFYDVLKVEYGLNSFTTRNNYTICNSWMTYNKSIKKSNKQYEINEVSNEALNVLGRRLVYIDWSMWDIIVKVFLGDKRVDGKIVDYDFLFEIIEDIIVEMRNGGTNDNIENKKLVQKLYYFMISSKIKSGCTNSFYMSYFYDFRGRMYPNYFLDVVYMKFLRPFFYFIIDERVDEIVNSNFYKKLNNIFKFSNINEYYIIVCKIEIGKLYKSKIKSNSINVKEFIELYNSYKDIKLKDVEDELYRIRLNKALSGNNFNNLTIIKDSTASTFQHWAVELDYKDEFRYTLNLDGDCWFDTYKVILDKFSEFSKYLWFLRKYWKKFAMKIGYNSGFANAIEDVIDDIKLDIEISLEEELEIKGFGRLLYDFIKEEMFEIWYENRIKDIIEPNIFTTDDCNINLLYFEKKIIYIKKDYKHCNLRWIFSHQNLKYISDLKSTKRAKNANMIQCKDGHLARFIIIKVKNIYVIHDSFGVNIYDLHLLMDSGNEYFNKYTNRNYYSIFIFL